MPVSLLDPASANAATRSETLRLLQRSSALLALLCALAPPVLLFLHLRAYEAATIRTEAIINARMFADIINRAPDFWQFQTDKLEDLLGRRSTFGNAEEHRRIVDLDGQLIAQSLGDVPEPRIRTREPLLDAGTAVAWLEIERSMQLVHRQVALTALLSLLAAVLLYLGATRIPLKALREAMDQLNTERDRALLTLRSIGDAVVITDAEQRVESLNPVAEQLSGWRSDEVRGRPIDAVLRLLQADTREPVPNPVQECLQTLKIVELSNHTVLVRNGDAAEFHIEDSAAPIVDRRGTLLGAIMVFHDVSDRVQAQQKLQHTAFHDTLTGLPNRDLFRSRLSKALDEARRDQRGLAVLFLDLDRFKAINDSLGHSAGDELLVLTAKRIRNCLREGDLVCRQGGDEFTALLHPLDGPAAAQAVSAKLLRSLSSPFNLRGQQVRVSGSIGIALFPEHGDSVEELLKNADTAMYQAKAHGRNHARLYAVEMNAMAGQRLRMAFALQLALERDEFRLVYQPKLRLADHQVMGAEALLRWHSAELGLVGPADFVPQLEESGGIVDVGRWVLKTAIIQARAWLDAGHALAVAVNVSAAQIAHGSLLADIADLLHAHALPPELLIIELTESMLMDDIRRSQSLIAELRHLGVRLSLDDFGTGFSSLGYLRQFAVQELKIDRSFVHDIDKSPAAARIVKTVVDLGHALDMQVTAEGIETFEQASLLRQMGCDAMQGFWLARPMRLEDLDAWLEARRSC